jgi:hypothetical protein
VRQVVLQRDGRAETGEGGVMIAATVRDLTHQHLLSLNAPRKRDVLGTLLLSVLPGHRRYAHPTARTFP